MPTAIDLPVKYKFRKGLDALTPPDETPDAFDPGALASADANEDPDPTPIPAPATSAADSGGPKVTLNPLSAGAPPRKFPEAKMPPPEPIEAPPQPTPDPGPQSAAATPAPPPTPQIIAPQQIGDLDRSAATSQDPNAINRGQILPEEEKSAADKLTKLHGERPEAPQSNWAQRLGTAILSMTKFAPAINQIMHPKWSEQNAAYQGQLKDLEAQQKEEETQASTDASVAQKEASAAQRNAQAASYAATQDTRRNSAKDRLDAAFIKAMGPNAMQLNPSEKVPEGFAVFTNPSNPNDKWIRRSAIVNLPKELMGEFPGLAEGAPITRKEFEDGLKSARTKDLENVKAGNRPDKSLNSEQRIAAISAGVDANKPVDQWTPQEAQAVEKQIEKHRQAIHVSVNSAAQAPLTASALDLMAEAYIKTNQIPALGYGSAGATQKARVVNRAAELLSQRGGGDLATNKATYEGLKSSNAQLQKLYGLTSAFENNTRDNMKLLESASQATDRTGVPLIDKYLLAVKKNVFADPDAAKLRDAIRTVANEVAKVRSGQQSGAATDSARAEAMDSIHDSMSKGQLSAVLQQMRAEMKNRTGELQHEIGTTQDSLRRLGGATGAGGDGQTSPTAHPDPLNIR